jgi:hypothetical protein
MTANEKWTWMEDYLFVYANYVVACETGRRCQVGMGIFAFDEPRGDDGNGPVKAAFVRKQSGLIPIIDKQF